MANTFVETGETLSYSNSGSAISSGGVVALATGSSGYIGIAKADIAATTGTGVLMVSGVHQLTKKSGDVFTVGAIVYWDSSNSRLTTSSTSNTRAGRVWAAAASAATTARVKINVP